MQNDLREEWPEWQYEDAGKEAYATGEIIRFAAIPTGERWLAHPEGHYTRAEDSHG